jgi:multisubunit Na+/H+ antiporter MnhB subunit
MAMANNSSMVDFHDDVEMTPGRGLILLLVLLLSGALAWAALAVSPDELRLVPNVEAALPESGVANPVTAVLLNFRGYDTLLEVGVLLLAIVGIWSMSRHARVWIKIPDDDPVLVIFARLLLPLMVIAAAYIFWLGADNPGGAFQGGAILGGMGVLWMAAAIWRPAKWNRSICNPGCGCC